MVRTSKPIFHSSLYHNSILGSTRNLLTSFHPIHHRNTVKLHAVFRIDHVVDNLVVVQDGLGDIQPQAAAAAVPVSGFIHPIEGSEDTLQIFLGNMDAGIFHGKHLVFLGDSNHSPHRRIGHSVSNAPSWRTIA